MQNYPKNGTILDNYPSSREHGLGIDNAVQFEVMLADGTFETANACENTDLFWALRGGGGKAWSAFAFRSSTISPHCLLYTIQQVVPLVL